MTNHTQKLMDALNNAKANNALASEPAQQAMKEDKPKSQVYANIGIPSTNPVTGEEEFLTVLGLGVDTAMPRDTSKIGTPAYLAKVEAENELLAHLQGFAEELEPDQEEILNFQVRIRRVKAPVQSTGVPPTYRESVKNFKLVG